jgi:hypothetical protein
VWPLRKSPGLIIDGKDDEHDLFHRHCRPIKFPGGERSFQFGRANAPIIPQPVHTMRGPKAGTGVASSKASTFITASWWHGSQVMESERTPFSRMLASVIGGPR